MNENWFKKPIPEEEWPFPKGSEVICRWNGEGRPNSGIVLRCELHHERTVYVYIKLSTGAHWGMLVRNVRLKSPLELLACCADDSR